MLAGVAEGLLAPGNRQNNLPIFFAKTKHQHGHSEVFKLKRGGAAAEIFLARRSETGSKLTAATPKREPKP